MSDALTPDALDDAAAVPEAPAPEATVDGGSAGGEESVPASRFNGLMSKYQSEKSQWDTDRAALVADLETLRANKETQSVPDDDVTELREELQQLRSLLVEERTQSVKDAVLNKYPEAKPFADLIIGGSAEEIEQVAAALSERVKLLTGGTGDPSPVTEEPAADAGAGATDPAASASPAAPEVGGAAPVTGAVAVDDKKRDALQRGDFMGFLEAKLEEQSFGTSSVS